MVSQIANVLAISCGCKMSEPVVCAGVVFLIFIYLSRSWKKGKGERKKKFWARDWIVRREKHRVH